jgi:hypothetical protein
VGLFLGLGLMLISWLVCLGLSTGLGVNLYWAMAAGYPTIPLGSREGEARRLATIVAAAVDSFHSVQAVSVGFVRTTGTAGLTYTRPEGVYSWLVDQLTKEPNSAHTP